MPGETSNTLSVCTHCGFTWEEFRLKRLLGCPQCYVCFAIPLARALPQIQPDLKNRPFPPAQVFSDLIHDKENSAHLRELLADALRDERYEEAARLRKRLGDKT
jgi:protein arginine kinase activator